MTSVTKGRNVSICEKSLKENELNRFSETIYKILKQCMNSQIFIADSVVSALQQKHLINKHNYLRDLHYGKCYDNIREGEQGFSFTHREGEKISLVENCKGYMQVSYFCKQDVEYVHYKQGIKQIIFIYEEEPMVTQPAKH